MTFRIQFLKSSSYLSVLTRRSLPPPSTINIRRCGREFLLQLKLKLTLVRLNSFILFSLMCGCPSMLLLISHHLFYRHILAVKFIMKERKHKKRGTHTDIIKYHEHDISKKLSFSVSDSSLVRLRTCYYYISFLDLQHFLVHFHFTSTSSQNCLLHDDNCFFFLCFY